MAGGFARARTWSARGPTAALTVLMLGVAGACLAVAGLEGWHMWDSRTTVIAADKVETANLTQSLSQHAHDLMQAVDVVLLGVRERVRVDGLSPAAVDRLHRVMRQMIITVPMIHGVFVYDAAGRWMANSVSTESMLLSNADREYFQFHRDNRADVLHIGDPVRSKSDGSWIITVSRRIDDAGGGFAGVVLVTISSGDLARFYAAFDLGKNGAITLLSAQGIVLAREPLVGTAPGTDLSQSQVVLDFLPGSTAGSFTSVYAVDGVTRLGSYRRVDGYPLVIVVAHGLNGVLTAWLADTQLHIAIAAAMVLALATLGVRFAVQMRRTQSANRRYQLLAENSSDVIACVGLDGERRYLSPSFSVLTGWSVRDGMSRSWTDFVHADDRKSIRELGARLLGSGEPVACAVRYVCRDGRARWAEVRAQRVAAMHALGRLEVSGPRLSGPGVSGPGVSKPGVGRPGVSGPGVGGRGAEALFVINLRDITERKQAEDQVAALNQELAVQATTDPLTGLANRRRFDESLTHEWRRAARERTALSVVMIDVDRFKIYNDLYGHQQGDECLRTVAAAVAGCTRRAGDLAARYGGEEFVLLLPGANEAAAERLAEGVRAALQGLGVVHDGNPPTGVVTASFGLAAMMPVPDDPGCLPGLLLAAADAALYEAKHRGRNRVVARVTAVAGS